MVLKFALNTRNRYIESNFSTFTCIGANFCVQFSFHNKRVWKIWTYDTKHFSLFLLRNNWKNKFISNTQFKIHFTKNNIIDNYSSFQKTFIYTICYSLFHTIKKFLTKIRWHLQIIYTHSCQNQSRSNKNW